MQPTLRRVYANNRAAFSTGARLDALDNLRGIFMLLGILLHVTVIYAYRSPPMVVWHDDRRSLIADLLMMAIHAFRMPAFLILAGFFAALLTQSRGPGGLLRHRLARIALPFALFWPFVGVATGIAAVIFLNRMMLGQWGLDGGVLKGLPIPKGLGTIHLWFLWMLLWYSVATALLLKLPRAWFKPIAAALASLARQP